LFISKLKGKSTYNSNIDNKDKDKDQACNLAVEDKDYLESYIYTNQVEIRTSYLDIKNKELLYNQNSTRNLISNLNRVKSNNSLYTKQSRFYKEPLRTVELNKSLIYSTNSRSRTIIPCTNSGFRAMISIKNKPKAIYRSRAKMPRKDSKSRTLIPSTNSRSRARMPSTLYRPRDIDSESIAKQRGFNS
jgi:hypothetical protein